MLLVGTATRCPVGACEVTGYEYVPPPVKNNSTNLSLKRGHARPAYQNDDMFMFIRVARRKLQYTPEFRMLIKKNDLNYRSFPRKSINSYPSAALICHPHRWEPGRTPVWCSLLMLLEIRQVTAAAGRRKSPVGAE